MRGGYLHNVILIESVASEAISRGARTWREYAMTRGPRTGYMDLLIEFGTYRIAVEAELTPKRVANDVAKAIGLGVQELWIVVPDAQIARAVHRRLNRVTGHKGELQVFVLTQGQAKQRIMNSFPFCSRANVSISEKENKGRH